MLEQAEKNFFPFIAFFFVFLGEVLALILGMEKNSDPSIVISIPFSEFLLYVTDQHTGATHYEKEGNIIHSFKKFNKV